MITLPLPSKPGVAGAGRAARTVVEAVRTRDDALRAGAPGVAPPCPAIYRMPPPPRPDATRRRSGSSTIGIGAPHRSCRSVCPPRRARALPPAPGPRPRPPTGVHNTGVIRFAAHSAACALPVLVPVRDGAEVHVERLSRGRDHLAVGPRHRPLQVAGEVRDRARPVAAREEDAVGSDRNGDGTGRPVRSSVPTRVGAAAGLEEEPRLPLMAAPPRTRTTTRSPATCDRSPFGGGHGRCRSPHPPGWRASP